MSKMDDEKDGCGCHRGRTGGAKQLSRTQKSQKSASVLFLHFRLQIDPSERGRSCFPKLNGPLFGHRGLLSIAVSSILSHSQPQTRARSCLIEMQAMLCYIETRNTGNGCVYRMNAARLRDVFVCKVSTEQHEGNEHEDGAVESRRK